MWFNSKLLQELQETNSDTTIYDCIVNKDIFQEYIHDFINLNVTKENYITLIEICDFLMIDNVDIFIDKIIEVHDYDYSIIYEFEDFYKYNTKRLIPLNRDSLDNAIKSSTKGYPVADIYRDDDGSTILEFALAGFARDELSIDVQPDKRTITVTGNAKTESQKRSRIARRNFTRTYVNYDDNLDLPKTHAHFENGLLTLKVPQRDEVKPLSIDIE